MEKKKNHTNHHNICHNWGLNLSHNILQVTIQIISDFHRSTMVFSKLTTITMKIINIDFLERE